MLKRNREVLLWLTDEELNTLKRNAGKSKLSVQAYLRSLINQIQLKARPCDDFFEMLKEMRSIGINLNQVAVKANSIGFIDIREYRDNVSRL